MLLEMRIAHMQVGSKLLQSLPGHESIDYNTQLNSVIHRIDFQIAYQLAVSSGNQIIFGDWRDKVLQAIAAALQSILELDVNKLNTLLYSISQVGDTTPIELICASCHLVSPLEIEFLNNVCTADHIVNLIHLRMHQLQRPKQCHSRCLCNSFW